MENIDFATLFQGIGTMMASGWVLASARVFLVLLGLLLIYLGWKGILEPMVMIPMGLGMVAINCGTLIMPDGTLGNLFLDPMLSDTDQLMNTMQIDFLQPVYTLTFSNGLIACFVFMGIGTLLDVGFLLQKPFASIFLALCAELGTFLTVPIASALGLTLKESASVAMVGGADGPMVLFTSLALAKHLFVPITVVAYLYLGLTYGGYPYLVKLLVPKRFRAIKMVTKKAPKNYDAKVKLAFSAVLCAILCFLFPVASPLFFSLFLGVAVRESGMKHIYDFVSGPLLYGSTFMLGVLLGVLCDAHLLLDPKILKLLVLGIVALLLSGIGGIIGGYIMYIIKRGNYNPVIGIAAVSCVPTTAKVAQKIVSKDNPDSFVLGDALGANISGVITSAIMWNYEKRLQYPINITTPNAKIAQIIMSQYGGPDGEMGASMRYLSQRYSMPDRRVCGVLTDIGTEELAHLEMVATIVRQLTKGLSRSEERRVGKECRSRWSPYH